MTRFAVALLLAVSALQGCTTTPKVTPFVSQVSGMMGEWVSVEKPAVGSVNPATSQTLLISQSNDGRQILLVWKETKSESESQSQSLLFTDKGALDQVSQNKIELDDEDLVAVEVDKAKGLFRHEIWKSRVSFQLVGDEVVRKSEKTIGDQPWKTESETHFMRVK